MLMGFTAQEWAILIGVLTSAAIGIINAIRGETRSKDIQHVKDLVDGTKTRDDEHIAQLTRALAARGVVPPPLPPIQRPANGKDN